MADNVSITAGSGTTVHADEYTHTTLGSGKTQLVKLVDGTLDSDTAIAAGGGVEAGALRVTVASDSTGVLSVDDNGGSLTIDGTVTANLSATDNAVLDAIQTATEATQTAVELIDNAISGTEMQVDVVAALPAGTNNIGDVDVLSVVPGTAATSLGKAIDSAAGGTDTGIAALAIRDDSLTTLTPVDGDYVPLRVSSTGALHVTGGGGGTEYNEDAATPGTITGSATLMERDDALTTVTPIEGDWIGLRGTAEGALWVQDFNSDAILADTANMDTNLGTIAGAVSGTEMQVDIVADGAGLATAANQTTIIGHVDGIELLLGAINNDTTNINGHVGDVAGCVAGTEMQCDIVASLPAGTNNIGDVDIASSVALDVSAATVTVDLGANNDVICTGNVAHDAADSGSPLKIGGKAKNIDGTAPGTAVAEDDRVDFIADVYGRQLVETTHPNLWSATDNQATAQTNTQLKAAPGAGLSLYITDIIISNGATAGNVKLVEDTAGTPVDILEVMYFAANGGAVIPLKTPIKVTANTNVGYTSASVTTHSVNLSGFIAP